MPDHNAAPQAREPASDSPKAASQNGAQGQAHWQREHYVPIRKSDLIQRLASTLDESDRSDFLDLCELIDLTYRLEFHKVLEELKDYYVSVSPDTEVGVEATSRVTLESNIERLFEDFEGLLRRANFTQLSAGQVQDAVGDASDWGVRMHIDFGMFDRVDVYARGDVIDQRERTHLYFWKRKVEVPIYQRVAVIFRLKNRSTDDNDNSLVFIRLLKNIPKQDVDMLLPGGKVKMTLVDGGKILLPTVSGIAIAVIKVFKGVVLLTMAGFYGLIALLGLILGTVGYGARSFVGYKRIKAAYELHRTKRLYYQHLDTNAGVLCRLIDEAQEQEIREVVLAYFMLWNAPLPNGYDEQRLDQCCEAKLKELTGVDVDFEVDDALRKLLALGIAESDDHGQWRCLRIRPAIRKVDQRLHGLLP